MKKLISIGAGSVVAASLFLATPINGVSQDSVNTLSLEEERSAELEKFDVTEIPDLNVVRNSAKHLFSLPLEKQDSEQLKELARVANMTANLVNYIYDEYDDYYRDNYRYEFIQKKVQIPASVYGAIFNEFLKIRNQAYFNLGLISKNDGRTMEAFLYFKDAFRLSSFDCGKDKPAIGCMRWKAEQELQKLLVLSHVKAYVSW